MQCEVCQEFYRFITCTTASLINSIIQEKNGILYLSFDLKITLKSLFCVKTLRFCHYVICTQHSYGYVESNG